jgi:hypothetical protein
VDGHVVNLEGAECINQRGSVENKGGRVVNISGLVHNHGGRVMNLGTGEQDEKPWESKVPCLTLHSQAGAWDFMTDEEHFESKRRVANVAGGSNLRYPDTGTARRASSASSAGDTHVGHRHFGGHLQHHHQREQQHYYRQHSVGEHGGESRPLLSATSTWGEAPPVQTPALVHPRLSAAPAHHHLHPPPPQAPSRVSSSCTVATYQEAMKEGASTGISLSLPSLGLSSSSLRSHNHQPLADNSMQRVRGRDIIQQHAPTPSLASSASSFLSSSSASSCSPPPPPPPPAQMMMMLDSLVGPQAPSTQAPSIAGDHIKDPQEAPSQQQQWTLPPSTLAAKQYSRVEEDEEQNRPRTLAGHGDEANQPEALSEILNQLHEYHRHHISSSSSSGQHQHQQHAFERGQVSRDAISESALETKVEREPPVGKESSSAELAKQNDMSSRCDDDHNDNDNTSNNSNAESISQRGSSDALVNDSRNNHNINAESDKQPVSYLARENGDCINDNDENIVPAPRRSSRALLESNSIYDTSENISPLQVPFMADAIDSLAKGSTHGAGHGVIQPPPRKHTYLAHESKGIGGIGSRHNALLDGGAIFSASSHSGLIGSPAMSEGEEISL